MSILNTIWHFIDHQYEKLIGAGLPAFAIAKVPISVQEEFALKTIWYLMVAPISVIFCTLAKKYVESMWEQYKNKKKLNNGKHSE